MDEIARQRQFEDQFLSQIRAKAAALTRGALPADGVSFEDMPDGMDSVRDVLTRLEIYDRDLLHRLPGTQTLQMRFRRSVLGGLIRPTVSRIRVQTLAPTEALVKDAAPGGTAGASAGQAAAAGQSGWNTAGSFAPIGREHVLDALARFEILPRGERPTGVVLASATGFSDGAKALVKTFGPPTLILMGGREDGGWDVTLPDAVARSPWRKMFELETQDGLLSRLMHHLDRETDLMDSRGVPIDELAAKLGIERGRTEALVRRACRSRARLMTVMHDGQVHVCRTPLAEEGNPMSMWSRIRKMLRMKPTVAERVRELTAQRVRLEAQRHELDRRVDVLEAEEVKTVKAGAAAGTDVEKRQLAGKLVRMRRELGRVKAQDAVLSKQIDILGTHVHHLTLTERNKRIALPKAEELTKEAAEAEHMMAELNANAELAGSIEVTGESLGSSEQEEAILAEFEAAAGSQKAAARKAEPAAGAAAGTAAGAAAGDREASADAARARTASAGGEDLPPMPASPARADASRSKRPESARPELS